MLLFWFQLPKNVKLNMITGANSKTENADGGKPEQKSSVADAAEVAKKTLKKLSASDLKRWHELQRKEKKDFGNVVQKASKKVESEPSDADSSSTNTTQEREELDVNLKCNDRSLEEPEVQEAVAEHDSSKGKKVENSGKNSRTGRNKVSKMQVNKDTASDSKVKVNSSKVLSKAKQNNCDVKVDEDSAGSRKRRSCTKKVSYAESTDSEDETDLPAKKVSAKRKPANKSKKTTKRRRSAKSKMRSVFLFVDPCL